MSGALRLGVQELRAGARGFGVFLACLALGVGAIAAAGSIAASFRAGLDGAARELLGGDVEVSVVQRFASEDVVADLRGAAGAVSQVATLNAMAEAGDARSLVDVKAVDGAHPLVGAMTLDPPIPLADALAAREGVWGAAAGEAMLTQFGLAVGDRFRFGSETFEVRTVLVGQPDEIGQGSVWPPAVIALEAARTAGLVEDGSIFRHRIRLTLRDGESLGAWMAREAPGLRALGLNVETRETGVDGVSDLLDTLEVFLAVVGLAALVAGGLGVAQAVSGFLATRIPSIAALKALGAESGAIRAAYLLQTQAMAAFGAALGVVLGALAPFALDAIIGDRLPLPRVLAIYPGPLLAAFALGLLAALAFSLPAIGRARATSPATLFRGPVGGREAVVPALEQILSVVAVTGFAGLAAVTSPRPLVTVGLLAGAAAAFALLLVVARIVMDAAKRLSRAAKGLTALGLSNLGGPGSIAPIAAPALGLGVALLTLIAVVQANLDRQLSETAPENLPSLFFTEIDPEDGADFDALAAESGVAVGDVEVYRRAPMLFGRMLAINGAPIDREAVAPGERWFVDGEIVMSYLGTAPPELQLAEGEWWPANYAGPPLVSLEVDAARGAGIGVGDRVTVLVLGREVEAEVASLRRIDFGQFGTNFAVVFAPGALEAANPRDVAIVKA